MNDRWRVPTSPLLKPIMTLSASAITTGHKESTDVREWRRPSQAGGLHVIPYEMREFRIRSFLFGRKISRCSCQQTKSHLYQRRESRDAASLRRPRPKRPRPAPTGQSPRPSVQQKQGPRFKQGKARQGKVRGRHQAAFLISTSREIHARSIVCVIKINLR
jgi:hypothetical protein